MTVNPEKLFAELEELGEEKVRTNLATHAIYGGDKVYLVEDWLRRKDQSREDALNREQIDIARDAATSARDAANSARDTAREARMANKIATTAIIIAIGSMIVALAK